jgi:hypothetical protein
MTEGERDEVVSALAATLGRLAAGSARREILREVLQLRVHTTAARRQPTENTSRSGG